MRDAGRSARPHLPPQDSEASCARPTEPGDPGRNGRAPASDVRPKATGGGGGHAHSDGEKAADRAARSAAEDLPIKRGVHPERGEPPDANGRSEAGAAWCIAEGRPNGKISSGMDAWKSKSELYNEAKNAGIAGRSAMTKEQLVEALRKHRAMRSPQQSMSQASGQRPSVRRQGPSEGHAAVSGVESTHLLRAPPDARRSDRCAIVYEGSGRRGEFHVVVAEPGGSRRSVARSPSFRPPRFGPLRRWGPARAAHELLVSRLEACGWWPVDSGGAWHELGFVRLRDAGMRSRRSLVTVAREPTRARFVAEELDAYGNPTPFMLSAPFSAASFLPVRPSRQARAALQQLVERMESEGWNVAAAVGKEWYAISLWRPTDGD
jgi:hypothetical protein